jgi:hypothetical protein
MSHNANDISSALDVSDTLAAGQAIKFSEGVALSGVVGTLGDAIAVIDSVTGEEKIWLYDNGAIGFGATDDRTSFRDNSGVQVDAYVGNTRAFYFNSNGINLGERQIQGARRRVLARTTDYTVNSQDTGIIVTNAGAPGTITITLPQLVAGGHEYTVVRQDDFPVRIEPTLEAILAPTGLLPVGNYIELASHGASVTLVAAAGGTWLTKNQNGTITNQ